MTGEKEIKRALFGGTFNPPHLGHMEIVKYAISTLGFDQVIVMPTGRSPHKKVDDIAPLHRYNMAKLAFDGIDGATVSDIEQKREGKSYTYDTIIELEKVETGKISVIMGEDMLKTIDSWYRAEDLLKLCGIVVFSRDKDLSKLGHEVERVQGKYGANITLATMEHFPYSSTAIRNAVKKGERPEGVMPSVLRYIEENRLYV